MIEMALENSVNPGLPQFPNQRPTMGVNTDDWDQEVSSFTFDETFK
jgi:hypothetical protein